MTLRIYKYQLDLVPMQTIKAALVKAPLNLGWQHNRVAMWALIDDALPLEDRQIAMVGTGHPLPEGVAHGLWHYIGTVDEGAFIWHFFIGDLQGVFK